MSSWIRLLIVSAPFLVGCGGPQVFTTEIREDFPNQLQVVQYYVEKEVEFSRVKTSGSSGVEEGVVKMDSLELTEKIKIARGTPGVLIKISPPTPAKALAEFSAAREKYDREKADVGALKRKLEDFYRKKDGHLDTKAFKDAYAKLDTREKGLKVPEPPRRKRKDAGTCWCTNVVDSEDLCYLCEVPRNNEVMLVCFDPNETKQHMVGFVRAGGTYRLLTGTHKVSTARGESDTANSLLYNGQGYKVNVGVGTRLLFVGEFNRDQEEDSQTIGGRRIGGS